MYDVDALRSLQERFSRLAGPPGLFHVTRVRLDCRPCNPSQIDLNWQEFLGSTVPFEFQLVDLFEPGYQQSCYFGAAEKLNDYTDSAAAALMQFPPGFSPRIDYHRRNARDDRNQWTLALCSQANALESHIAVDSRGSTRYADYAIDPKDASFLVSPPRVDFEDYKRFASGVRSFIERQYVSVPTYIYLSIVTDLFTASAHVISAHLNDLQTKTPTRSRPPRALYAPPSPETAAPTSSAGRTIPPAWPPDKGWHFRPGEFAFDGRVGEIRGKEAKVLQALADARGSLTESSLISRLWGEDGSSNSNLRNLLTRARNRLRATFSLSEDDDPIPTTDRGISIAWKIDEALLREEATIPGADSKQIKRRLGSAFNARCLF